MPQKHIDRPALSRSARLLALTALAAVLVDRYYFAGLTQWREDQATNLWLGLNLLHQFPPVGLLSSYRIFNPNGMPLVGFALSWLPNLLWVSFFLSMLQVAATLLLGHALWVRLSAHRVSVVGSVAVILAAPGLRATSGELWNQWVLTTPNLLLAWLLITLDQPSKWKLALFFSILLFIPGLYLSAPLNAAVFALLLLFRYVQLWRTDRETASRLRSQLLSAPVLLCCLTVAGFVIWATWLPFVKTVPLSSLAFGTGTSPGWINRVAHAAVGLVTFPWGIQYLAVADRAMLHADRAILSASARRSLLLFHALLIGQIVVAIVSLAWSERRHRGRLMEIFQRRDAGALFTVVLVPWTAYVVSALLNGPQYHVGERPDQLIQFFPFLVFTIFIVPAVMTEHRASTRIGQWILQTMLVLTVTCGAFSGFKICRDHLSYRGIILTNADVPLFDKRDALDFVAHDWMANSGSNPIPVDYDLAGRWAWVNELAEQMLPLFPAPMTTGRSFDYELKRIYGLSNYQEGVQYRSIGAGKYILSYATHPEPEYPGRNFSHRIFGRLRVSTATDVTDVSTIR